MKISISLRHRSQPCSAVGIAQVKAVHLLLDPLEVDAERHAPIQPAEFPDAVGEVDALLPLPRLGEPPVRHAGSSVKVQVLGCVRLELKKGWAPLCLLHEMIKVSFFYLIRNHCWWNFIYKNISI